MRRNKFEPEAAQVAHVAQIAALWGERELASKLDELSWKIRQDGAPDQTPARGTRTLRVIPEHSKNP